MSKSLRVLLSLSLVPFLTGPVNAQSASSKEEAKLDFFERKIRPLLANHCYNCHSADTNSRAGLRVDDRNGLLTGGGRGPAIVPGHPEKSLLIQAVKRTHKKVQMPPKKPLSSREIADLTQWIKDGAAWPGPRVPKSLGRPNPEYEKLRKQHWAFQPLRIVPAPAVKDKAWSRDDIDRFLLAKLESKGLNPVGDADAATLIRRVTFDLTGLPPTPAEVASFVKDGNAPNAKRQAAFAKVVDRLLASPAFGERWGRHWLDLARYGESTGSARNLPYPHAWRYRDYVIDAFNRDKPYDQFIREQIAGDLLPLPSPGGRGAGAEGELQRLKDERLIATGFLALGVRDVNQRFKVRFVMDNIDEQIDAFTRSMLALTVSCARCHDHKFDPIPTTDYYALAGIFHSSDLCAGLRNKMGGGGLDYYDTSLLLRLSASSGPDAKTAKRIEQAKAALKQARFELLELAENLDKNPPGPAREKKLKVARAKVNKIQNEMIALNDPANHGQICYGVRDAKIIGDTEVRIRGEAEKIGPVVPRGFLSAFDIPGTPKIPAKQSGRLELAQWLTSPKNPLTARVMANRIWHHLFGRGLVGSVDNFGVTGDKPSHPELLDYLALSFMRGEPGAPGPGEWSVKKLVRRLVLTRAYQLGSETTEAHLKADPANYLVWRHNPARLSAEEIRDAMLAASGKLDRARPKGSPAMHLKVIELTNVSPLAKKLEEAANTSVHRSIYLPLLRTLTPRSLEVFDFAEQGLVVGSRDATTVATQALYLLNDPFVRQQSQALAQRVLAGKGQSDARRITLAYALTLSRPATAKEIERATSYIADYENAAREEKSVQSPRLAAWSSFCQALLASAEFRYIR
ncbi:MAG: PSD1 domain-containing protein [Planctomycetes bacterium]|nr:PSD1 domain-containing protein [Planctomycetota bacterium]